MRLNLSEAVKTWAIRQGNAIAISGSRNVTYSELDKLASGYADCILSHLPDSNKKIAILSNDNIHFITFLLGIIRSGNVFVLINPNLSNDQINKSLETINCDYYISIEEETRINAKYIPLPINKNICNANCSTKLYPNTGLTENAGVIFSSGTTGEPKALIRNSFSILSEVIQWMIELQLQKGTTFLIPRPLYYTGGFILMYTSLFSGGRVDLLDDISSDNVLNYLTNNTCDWAFIVPSAIREMIASKKTNHIMVKNVLTMGSPIYHYEKVQFYDKFKCNIIEVWGNSEGLGTITTTEDLQNRPNSIGRPFFTDFLDVLNNNSKEDSINKEGLLFGISDNEFSEYIGKPELTNDVLHDGYIFSEDIGYKGKDGYFYLTGRAKDIIVIDGVKVFPKDIEHEILHNKHILDCAVFSLKDRNGNDIVSAALVMNDDSKPEIVIQEININLAPHEMIKSYIVLNNIPRNHGGKIDKNSIVSLFKK